MSIEHGVDEAGVAQVVVHRPPVNALAIADWFQLARIFRSMEEDSSIRVAILSARGRGFNAGVDIKEVQRLEGMEGLLGANRGCHAAFDAIYHCAVPVIAAVHGYCLGGGIGLVGCADLVLAAEDASFGLPEVDRGALGAATHLRRLVPEQRARHMLYTCERASSQELQRYGSVLEVLPRDRLQERAREIAASIAAKPAGVIRAAKACLNDIEPLDISRSYRHEQGYTFELNLAGHGDRARRAFVDGEEPT